MVAVLVVVAIAGIVLAGLRERPVGSGQVALPSPTQQPGSAPTTIDLAIAAEVGAGANRLGVQTSELAPALVPKLDGDRLEPSMT